MNEIPGFSADKRLYNRRLDLLQPAKESIEAFPRTPKNARHVVKLHLVMELRKESDHMDESNLEEEKIHPFRSFVSLTEDCTGRGNPSME